LPPQPPAVLPPPVFPRLLLPPDFTTAAAAAVVVEWFCLVFDSGYECADADADRNDVAFEDKDKDDVAAADDWAALDSFAKALSVRAVTTAVPGDDWIVFTVAVVAVAVDSRS